MDKAEMKALVMWAVKWTIVAVIVIVALQGRILVDQMTETLERHNQLLSAVVNEFKVISMQRAAIQKAQQELPQKGDPVPTEDRPK